MRLTHEQLATNCNEVRIGGLWMGFSYQTCVAAVFGGQLVRLDNKWGPTTNRHIIKLGAKGYTVVTEKELEALVRRAMLEIGMVDAKSMLGA